MGLWDVGQTARLASQGMNYDQSGWDSLQSWLDKKRAAEEAAAERARRSALLKQMADDEETARKQALTLQGKEQLAIEARDASVNLGSKLKTFEEWLSGRPGKIDAAISATQASDPFADGAVKVMGTDTDREDYESYKRGFETEQAPWTERQRKLEETISAGLTPFIARGGDVYTSLDNAKRGLRTAVEERRKKIKMDDDKAKLKAQQKLDDAEREQAMAELEATGEYSPEELKRIRSMGDLGQEIKRIQREASIVDPSKDKARAETLKRQHDAVTKAILTARANNAKSRQAASIMSYARGIDAEEAMARLDEQLASPEDQVLGMTYDPTNTLTSLANRFAQIDPEAKPTENAYLQRLLAQTKGDVVLDKTRLQGSQNRDTGFFNLARDSRKWQAQAETAYANILKDKEAIDAKLKEARRRGENDIEIQRMKNEQSAMNELVRALAKVDVAKIGQVRGAQDAFGVILAATGDVDMAAQIWKYFSPGRQTDATNLQQTLDKLRQQFGITPGMVQQDVQFSEKDGVGFGPLKFGGGLQSQAGGVGPATPPSAPEPAPKAGEKKTKKGAKHPYSPEKVAAAAKKGLKPIQRPDGSWYFGKK